MNSKKTSEIILKFNDFQLNLETGELFDKNGEYVKLQQQPAKVLGLLANRTGKLVTREEIQNLLWQDETFVDYEQGINYCIKQIRNALNDDSKTPEFIETLPRRGYRFIAKVENINPQTEPPNVQNQQTVGNGSEMHAETTYSLNSLFRSSTFQIGLISAFFIGSLLVLSFAFSNPTEQTGVISSNNPEAQDAYLKGIYWFDKGEFDSIEKSIEHFDQAIRQDEKFASAYAARADAFYQLGVFGRNPTTEVFPLSKKDALKALELNANLANANTILGSIAFRFDWDWNRAEKHFKKAIELDPDSANAHHDYAWLLVSQKRFEEAIASIKKAQKLDATSPRTNTDVGWIYMRARRYDEAIAQIKRTLELQPDFIAAQQCLECAFFNKAMYKESVKNGLELLKKFGATEDDLFKIQQAPPKEGVKLIENWRLKKMIEGAKTSRIPSYAFAVQYAAVGDSENAFIWLEKALQDRDANLVTLQVDQVWDQFRDEPAYQETLKKIGLNPAQ